MQEKMSLDQNLRLDLAGLLIDVLEILPSVICDFHIGRTVGFTNELDLLRRVSSYMIANLSFSTMILLGSTRTERLFKDD